MLKISQNLFQKNIRELCKERNYLSTFYIYIYFLYGLQEQSSGFHFFISFLKLLKDCGFFMGSGSFSEILGPRKNPFVAIPY